MTVTRDFERQHCLVKVKNNAKVSAGHTLFVQETLRPFFESVPGERQAPRLTEADHRRARALIAHEADEFVVVDKPPGVVCQGAPRSEPRSSLPLLLRHYFAGQGLERSVNVVHRLDRAASGLLVVALTPRCAAALSRLAQASELKKTYRVVTQGLPATFLGRRGGFKGRLLLRFLSLYLERHKHSRERSRGRVYAEVRALFREEGSFSEKAARAIGLFGRLHRTEPAKYVEALTDFLVPGNYPDFLGLLGLEVCVGAEVLTGSGLSRVGDASPQVGSALDFGRHPPGAKRSETLFSVARVFKVDLDSGKASALDFEARSKGFLQGAPKFSDFYLVKALFRELAAFAQPSPRTVFFSEARVRICKGNKHQIRVVLAKALETPVLLDAKYGYDFRGEAHAILCGKSQMLAALAKRKEAIFLHCDSLAFGGEAPGDAALPRVKARAG